MTPGFSRVAVARTNVFVRSPAASKPARPDSPARPAIPDEPGVNGFLFLAKQPANETHVALCWTANAVIPLPELPVFLAAASLTDSDDLELVGSTLALESAPDNKHVSLLDDIQSMSFSPQLTLSNGQEACIVVLSVHLQDGSSWPDLWVDAAPGEPSPPTLDALVHLLRGWLRRSGHDLVACDVPNLFFVSDRIAAPAATATTGVSSRWPDGLPQPSEGSTIYRAGAFGMGVVTSIVGRPIANKLEDVGWNVLEGFAKVTTFAKTKTSQALEHPLARPFLPYVPEQIRTYFISSAEAEALINEYDSAGHYLARFAADLQSRLRLRNRHNATHPVQSDEVVVADTTRSFEAIRGPYKAHFSGHPLTLEEWKSWHSADGRLDHRKRQFYARIFSGGIEPSLRKVAWKFLLGEYALDSTAVDRERLEIVRRKQYRDLKLSWQESLTSAAAAAALEASESDRLVPNDGPVGDENENADLFIKLKDRKYRIEKDVVRTDRNVDYYGDASDTNASDTFAGLPVGPNLVVLRDVLMTYTIYNFDLGYVQGMSDLCAPILAVTDNEADAFWCFAGFMDKMKSHFSRDQVGMKTELRRLELLVKLVDPPLLRHLEQTDAANMFCCFRWLLIHFKREFPFDDIQTLWESAWACPFTEHFHLFAALAILNMHRGQLFQKRAFDEVLKFVNGLSGEIPVPDVLQRGEVLFYLARDLAKTYGPADGVVQAAAVDGETSEPRQWLDEICGSAETRDGASSPTRFETTPIEAWADDASALTPDEWAELLPLFVAPQL